MIPTSGGITASYYAVGAYPYGLPYFSKTLASWLLPTDIATSGTSNVEISAFISTVYIPANATIRLAFTGSTQASATNNTNLTLWDGAVGSGTILKSSLITSAGAGNCAAHPLEYVYSPTAGSHTYRFSIQTTSSTSNIRSKVGTLAVGDIGPASFTVELV